MTRCAIAAAALAAALVTGCSDGGAAGSSKNGPAFRFAPIVRTDIVRTVEATGKVTPRNTADGIPVGAQVNGKVIKMFVDYNSTVTNGQVVALIDPLVYEATYKSALAQLHVNEANVEVRRAAVESAKAALDLAEKTFARKQSLAERKLAAQADFDSAESALARAKADLGSAEAAVKSALASVEQSEAAVSKAKADLDYCTIRSPVNGVVIARKVDEGETVVSSMNAVPVLTIAEDLKTIWIEATVPEADVGDIKVGQEVTFTADVPGMTATLSIETARAENAVVVSAAAFRFRPRDSDRASGEAPRGRKIWLVGPDGKLSARVVSEGVTDGSFTQILDADDLEGSQAVAGYETARTAAAASGDTRNPFMPKMPRRGTSGTAPEPKK